MSPVKALQPIIHAWHHCSFLPSPTGDLPETWHDSISGDACYLLAEALELASLWHIPVLVQELVRAVCEEVDAETAPYLLVTCAKLGHKQEVEVGGVQDMANKTS